MGGFRGVSLQASLVTEIEAMIEQTKHYKSVAEFVSEAVRLRLETLRKNPSKEANLS